MVEVSDEYEDKSEIQDNLEIMNLNLSRDVNASGQIQGINDISDSDIM